MRLSGLTVHRPQTRKMCTITNDVRDRDVIASLQTWFPEQYSNHSVELHREMELFVLNVLDFRAQVPTMVGMAYTFRIFEVCTSLFPNTR